MVEGRRAREIFQQAVELPRERRGAFLEERCAGDAGLRAEVESLLEFDEGGDGFLEGTPFTASPSLAARMGLRVPERFGRYRVIRLVGEGGMGAVYEAEQENPRRKVALKVVYPAFASGQLLRRFEHEAHVLGQLKHPGIGQIFEAGWEDTPYGRQPYFAMEFVSGPTLTEYAERAGLGVRERLELMARVCEAIQHAHMKGVIHRDLKPANILVEEATERRSDGATKGGARAEVGQPKILDFGIARMTDSDIRYATVQTNVGQLLGTVPYMSPEQVSGDPSKLDARSDVYALGVLMYELLAGRLPYDVHDRPLPEVARVIREQEPRTLAGIDPALAGDVSTIVGKALAKEPERRYQSAADLAADIRRHLHDEPISARPPTTFYQLQKFARRNKALVGGVAAAFVTLVVAVVVVASLAVREANLRRVADESAAAARRLAYRTSIAAAAAALDKHQRSVLRERLDEAPEELRGWEWAYLDRLYDRSVATARLDPGERLLGFDGDGEHVLTLSRDGRVRKLDAAGGREVARAGTGARGVAAQALSPDGSLLLIVDASGRAAAVEAEGWRERWAVEGIAASHGPVFSADGALVALALAGSPSVIVVETSTGRVRDTIRVGPGQPSPLAFRPDGSGLLVLDEPRVVEVDFVTGERRTAPRADRLALSPDGREAYTTWAAYITVYDTRTWSEMRVLEGVTGPVIGWDIAHGRGIAALGETSGWISFRDAASGELLNVVCAHGSRAEAVAFSPDGSRLASLTREGELKVWDTPEEPIPVVIPPSNDNINAAAFGAGGSLLATTGWGSVKVWDTRTGAERWLRVVSHPREQGGAVAFDREGETIAAALRSPGVWVFGVDVGAARVLQEDREELVDALAWTPDGRSMVVVRKSGIEVVDATSGATGAALKVASEAPRFTCAAAWGDEPRIAAGAADGSLWLWEVGAAAGERVRAGRGSPASCIEFSPEGDIVAAGHADGSVTIAALGGDREVRAKLPSPVCDLEFHTDGSRLLATSRDGHVHVLRASDAEDLLVLDCSTDVLVASAFVAGGEGIAACGPRIGFAVFEPGSDAADRRARGRFRAARRFMDAGIEGAHWVSADVLARARENASIPADIRSLVVEQAAARGDQANWLNSSAWGFVQYPNQPIATYERGLRMAEAAVRVMPDYQSYLNTLGVAQYRVGRHAEAAATFERCNELNAASGAGPSAYDVVFLAMAYQGMGRATDARTALGLARELISRTGEPSDLRSMLREAESVIPRE